MTRHRIGLRREDKNAWERRVALTPDAVRRLTGQGVEVWAERFDRRAFGDEEFLEAGARLVDDVRGAEVVLGIKEMPLGWFREGGAYVFFSHTIKGQSFNMPMLAELIAKRCTLIDYECVADEQGRRLVFFSHHAGVTGMIDSLWALGERLRVLGHETPFASLRPAHRYADLEEARGSIERAGRRLADADLSDQILPLVVGFTGTGNVARGAQEIFELLPHENVAPEELVAWIAAHRGCHDRVARVAFDHHHLVERNEDGGFDKAEYYEHPNRYRSRFAPWLEHLTLLVHGVYWDERFPVFASRSDLAQVLGGTRPAKLVAVGDITCDVQGSLASTVRDTEPGDPVYVYDPFSGAAPMGFEGEGIAVMAVGNLPTELPIDASISFSRAFERFVPALAAVDLETDFARAELPPEIRRAVILWRGEFTPEFEYMKAFVD